VALDVLDDHDGVVHHEAGGERDAEEREGVDGEASSLTKAKVPMRETGMVTAGMRVVRQSSRNTKMTRMTSAMATASVKITSWMEADTTSVVSKAMRVPHPRREALGQRSISASAARCTSRALALLSCMRAMPTASCPLNCRIEA
jgi:hypothetical protein